MTVAPTPVRSGRLPQRRQVALIVAVVLVTIGAVLLLEHTVFDSSTTSSSGVQGSGIPASQARDVSGFSAVDLAGSNNVAIHVGGKRSVVVHADDNLLDHVTAQVQAGRLVIGNTGGSFTAVAPMHVDITVPSLAALTLSGSGNITADGISTTSLTVALTGSGNLQASGTARRLNVRLDGSGEARLEQLVARDVRAAVNGSGEILVHATESLAASVPGSGSIVYTGNPGHVTTGVTGSGSVIRG